MGLWLLIDDERDLYCQAIARTPEVAKHLLRCNCWECVCFDHDLGCNETGYDIMMWMFNSNIYPPKIQLVTSNPVGRKNMGDLLKSKEYNSIDGINWKYNKE